MAFYCKCNHTRGKHDNPTKSNTDVGKCKEIVGVNFGKQVICACRHYSARDRKLSQLPEWRKLNIAYMLIATACAFGITAWIGSIEESIMIGYLPIHLGASTSGLLVLLCWYFKFGESYFARLKKECLE